MKPVLATLAVGLCLAAAAPSPLTVDTLLADPGRYDGKLVRLHGFIDQCTANSCHVCASALPGRNACVVLHDWYAPFQGPGVQGFEGRYRFAEVILKAGFEYYSQADEDERMAAIAEAVNEGIYDPVAVRLRPGDRDNVGGKVGDTWLANVVVEQVIVQRPATDGLILDEEDRPIRLVADDKDILRAFARQAPPEAALRRGLPARVFAEPLYGERVGPGEALWVCQATVKTLDRWPQRTSHLLYSPGNPYRCYRGVPTAGGRPQFDFRPPL